MELPDFLKTQIREGKVVLVFGAGATRGATDSRHSVPPDGNQLGRLIADRFLGGKFTGAPLSQISEYAISESSLVDVQEFIRQIFENFEPAAFHKLIPQFRWHGLATTNYDRVIEKAYQSQASRLQNIQPIITNGDRTQDALRSLDNVLLLKLHGCISRTADPLCPLILTTDQYVQYKAGRSRLFTTLQEWAYERPLVFIGHSIQDPDLRAILLEMGSIGENRARCFGVVPDADAVTVRFWDAKKLSLLNGTCQDFFETLDREIPNNSRVLAGLIQAYERHPIAERFRSAETILSDTSKSFLANDVQFVRSATAEHVDPKNFYRGLSPGWAAIEQNLDVRRKLADTILTDVVLAEESERPVSAEVFLIKGHAGSGKSVLLRRLAWDASHDYGAVVLFLQSQGVLVASAIRELLAAIGDRLYIFVDDAADRSREIVSLIREIGPEGKRLTLVLAERINEWNVGGTNVDPYLSEQYVVPYLELPEIDSLIALLSKHRALGTMEKWTREEQVSAFAQRAGRQLLVALHEATLGLPFEQIIKDEYDKIVPLEAQQMYLSVCVLNRLNVPVRAGVIARMHDLPFDFFEKRFFKPLEHVVQTAYDSLLRDHTYAARHAHIAEMVFQSVLTNADERLDKYLRCLKSLNIEFSTDERAFRQMVRGKVVQDLFPSSEMARHLFRVAQDTVGADPYLLQQIALYEMNSLNGSLTRANELLDMAAAGAPYDPSIKHSKSELLLRLADAARTPLEREQRLREAMRIATSLRDDRQSRGGTHAFHTIVKVGLRRLEDLVEGAAEAVSEEALSNGIRAVEDSLLDGLQRFPADPYLLTSEAKLATLLNDSARALAAMRSAFKTNPRNSAIAVRLAKSLEQSGDQKTARLVIQTGLDNSPGDKKLHFALAQFLLRYEPSEADQVEYHLRRSFTDGDTNYDAQLLYARQLYIKGDLDGSKARFRSLGSAKLAPDARDRVRYPLTGHFSGRVSRMESTYCFISRDGVGDWVFGHRSEVAEGLWPALKVGERVHFGVGFTFKGQTATGITRETIN